MKNLVCQVVSSVALAAYLGGIASVTAVPVTPSSYTISPAAASYPDSGGELTNGQLAILGGSLVPYVGWDFRSGTTKTINFTFDKVTHFDSVSVSALQWGAANNIVLPDISVLSSTDGTTWSPVASLLTPFSSANNNKKAVLSLTGLNTTSQYLQVQVKKSTGGGVWAFVDEVSFTGQRVPEGGSTIALLALGITSLIAARRKKA